MTEIIRLMLPAIGRLATPKCSWNLLPSPGAKMTNNKLFNVSRGPVWKTSFHPRRLSLNSSLPGYLAGIIRLMAPTLHLRRRNLIAPQNSPRVQRLPWLDNSLRFPPWGTNYSFNVAGSELQSQHFFNFSFNFVLSSDVEDKIIRSMLLRPRPQGQ